MQHLLTPPEKWQWGEFKNKDGKPVRYGMSYPDNAKALIVIAEGRTECIEEHFENIRDLNANGYACAIMDWQGQGLSYRFYDDNSRHHSIGFNHDVMDFSDFVNHLPTNIPKILFAHSMGANITLQYIHDYPDTFKSAFMVAPMYGLQPKRIIRYLSKYILSFVDKIHAMKKHAFGQTAWSERTADIIKHKISSDKIRQNLQPYLFKTRPSLRCGGVTFGWLKHALESIEMLQNPDYCKTIKTPIFIAIADKDSIVDNDATKKIAANLPNCEIQIFKKSQHQIHREHDSIRNALIQSFYNFVKTD